MATKKPTGAQRSLSEFVELFQQLAELEFLLKVPLKMHTELGFAATSISSWNELFDRNAPKEAITEALKALPSFSEVNGIATNLSTQLFGTFLDHPGWRTPGKRQPNCAQIMDDVFESLMRNSERFWIFGDSAPTPTKEEEFSRNCDISEENERNVKAVETVRKVVKERCSRLLNRLSDQERQEAINKLAYATRVKKRINPAMPEYVKEEWRWELEPAQSKSKEDG